MFAHLCVSPGLCWVHLVLNGSSRVDGHAVKAFLIEINTK